MQTQIINFFFNKMINCITENRQYIIPTLEEETKVNPRLSHADYCSNLIGSAFVGSGGRGIFAKADITPGALLVAAKAICCVYEDEVEVSQQFMPLYILRYKTQVVVSCSCLLQLGYRLFPPQPTRVSEFSCRKGIASVIEIEHRS